MESFGSGLMASFATIIPFLVVLTVVVFIHELGHFLVARWCGIRVLAFSIGFGPELFGRNDKHGTRWKLSAIPLGGYVKFAGDESAASTPDHDALQNMSEEEAKGAFHMKNVWQRAAVVAAGPIANFLLAIVLFACLLGFYGKMETVPRVDSVRDGSAAQIAGIMPDDVIVAIDGTEIKSFGQVQRIVSASADMPLQIEVSRDGQLVTLSATPALQEISDRFGNKQKVGILGIQRDTKQGDWVVKEYGPLQAVWGGVSETWFVVERTGAYIGGLFVGKEDTDQIGGPIRIAQMSGQVASIGIVPLINWIAVISVSIGLLNLMPVPMLDGGHLLYYLVEIVRGKPLSERVQEVGFRIGITLLLLLMVFATRNDLLHLFFSE
ncbi:RIP metalloprotease RseP [Rhodobacteraceae bacterium RKSG542]|uniref:RIP metalloprotease RseP n=1 Tax=Pseudovibrio flavus TaxID=2529854 RepID=UPI0012BBC296|nr:RIP metalloprotease RseP [Pseudovibrio flavus]MTI16663.1 RIP metalloprotease RseP [Pseudovibrio flavus]